MEAGVWGGRKPGVAAADGVGALDIIVVVAGAGVWAPDCAAISFLSSFCKVGIDEVQEHQQGAMTLSVKNEESMKVE